MLIGHPPLLKLNPPGQPPTSPPHPLGTALKQRWAKADVQMVWWSGRREGSNKVLLIGLGQPT